MNNIRNFSIISHVDHGKSTLSDRFLELTGTIAKEKMQEQYLDMMDLEREKGITIKMQPCRMNYSFEGIDYILNLIDTPGHVDFSYEVSRSLAAVEGAVLLVDATKGIQAQTLANLELARKQNIIVIPAVNKIDSPIAKIEETEEELANLLGINKDEILRISGKSGENVKELLETIIKKVPFPKGDLQKPSRALIFDSKYDLFKGVLAYVRVVDGSIKSGDKIYLMQAKAESEAKEVGYFKPIPKPAEILKAGEIGYIATGIKEPGKVRVGDTITVFAAKNELVGLQTEPLPGYKEPKPMVFASIYPENPDDYELLRTALSKLKLNDAAFTFEPETKESLGRGFRCGFLGSLHTEIVSERLKREFDLSLVISSPSAVFRIIDQKDKEVFIFSSSDWPQANEIKEIYEPWVQLDIVTPVVCLGRVSEMIKNMESRYVETKYFSQERMILSYEVPLREIISGFYDNLKSVSQGLASMDYKMLEYRPAFLIKLEIYIAGKKEEAFSRVVPEKSASKEGQRITEKLKNILPKQLFAVPIQAVVGGKIIARETISANRRDVIAPLYGGDYTRKKKLLEKQKEGKKKLKDRGDIRIPANVFLEMLKD